MRDREATTRLVPNGSLIVEHGWLLAGFGRHRDSDTVEESNFRVAVRILSAAFEIDDVPDLGRPWADTPDDDMPPLAVAHFRHWGVGWIDELVVRADHEALLAHCDKLIEQVEAYPILDEDDWGLLEDDSEHLAGHDS
jgi:hypothetical protein